MIAAQMGYALAIALLFTFAALAGERLLAIRRWPRRGVWAVALTMSAALPFIAIFSGEAATTTNPMHFAVPSPSWLQRSDLDALLIGLWMLASGAMLLFLAMTSLRLRRALRNWPVVRIDDKAVSIADGVGPAVFGIVHPRIILPRWLLDAPQATRSTALEHELAHIAARDPLMLVFALLLVALVPWNLPLWWQLRRLRFAIEVDCDARVLKNGIDPATYGETLLCVGQHRSRLPLAAVALIEPASQLERRVRIMLLEKSRSSVLLTVALLGVSAACVACATQLQPPASEIPFKVGLFSKSATRTTDGSTTTLTMTGDVKIRVPAGALIQVASERASEVDGGRVLEGAVRINVGDMSIATEKATFMRAGNGDDVIDMDSATFTPALR